MSNTIAPAAYVAPPGVEPTRFGLLSVAQTVDDPDLRWELGVEWEALTCARAGVASIVCDTFDEYAAPGYPLEARDAGEELVEVTPFIVVGSYTCKSASRDLDEAEERARIHLAAGEERAVEYALATAAAGNAPSFQGATDLTPGGSAVDLSHGFGLLEAYLAENYHSVGTIHAPRLLAPAIGEGQYAWRQGQRLETLVGTFVVAGGGYDLASVSPTGAPAAAGTAWLYATGRPQLRRGQVFVNDEQSAFDRGTNDVTFYAQRTYAVGWDCVTAAVLVEAPGGNG